MSATNVLRIAARGVATSAARRGQSKGIVPNTASYKKVQELQNIMCRDDGLLVWQKRGVRDSALFQFTMGLMIFGFLPLGSLFYSMAVPQKTD